MKRGDMMEVKVTNPELMNLCWFGTDIAQGAAVVGDFEGMDTGDVRIERIVKQGDTEAINSMPFYAKFQIENNAYTINFLGISVPTVKGENIIKDIELPGINAPLMAGKKFRIGQEEPKKRRRRRRHRRAAAE